MTVHPRMSKAVASLIVSQPFFGTLACNLNLKETKSIPTMATDGRHLFYSPVFLDSIDDRENLFVVAHEVMHCALFHHTRRGDRDPRLWNIACDYVVNVTLLDARIGTMPKCGLLDLKYRGWNVEDVYRDLEKSGKHQRPKKGQGGKGKGQGTGTPGEGEPDSEGDGEGQKPGSDDPGGCGAILDAGDAGEIAEAEAEWQTIVRQAVNVATKHAGKLPAYLEGLVGELKKPKQNWREILRRFVDPCSRYDTTWMVPDRRFGGAPFILPGDLKDGINHVAVIVDTSGSIDTEALKRFGGELNGLAGEGIIERLTVVYADTQVQRTEEFGRDDEIKFDPPKGGGTDFGPAVDWVAEHEPDVVCAIYFTDLYGGCGREPHFPVMWAAYGDPTFVRDKEMPFGEVIHIDD